MNLILAVFGGIAGLILGWFIGQLLWTGRAGRRWIAGLRLGLLALAVGVWLGRGSLIAIVTILAVSAGMSIAVARRRRASERGERQARS